MFIPMSTLEINSLRNTIESYEDQLLVILDEKQSLINGALVLYRENTLTYASIISTDDQLKALVLPLKEESDLPSTISPNSSVSLLSNIATMYFNELSNNHSEISQLEIVNRKGLVIASGLKHESPVYLSDPYFYDALQGIPNSGLLSGIDSTHPTIIGTYPIRSGSQVIGVVRVSLKLTNGAVERIEKASNTELLITNRTKLIPDTLNKINLESPADLTLLDIFDVQDESKTVVLNSDYKEALLSETPITNLYTKGQNSRNYHTRFVPLSNSKYNQFTSYIMTLEGDDLVDNINARKKSTATLILTGLSLATLFIVSFIHKMDRIIFSIMDQIQAMVHSNNVRPIVTKTPMSDMKALVDSINALIHTVIKREEENASLLNLTLIDGLTGLRNHKSFYQTVENLTLSPNTSKFAIAVLDIDDFKIVNDTYGHRVGDMVLMEISEEIKNISNDRISGFRYGGEEFTLLFSDSPHHEVDRILNNLRLNVREIHNRIPEMLTHPVSVSCGIAQYPLHGLTKEAVFEAADTAMYYSKLTGKNKQTTYHEEIKDIYLVSNQSVSSASASGSAYKMLLETLAARSPNTKECAYKVMNSALHLAKALQLDESTTENLRIASLLHDIGKISLPDKLLEKNDHFDNQELDIMQKHVDFSVQIVGQINADKNIVQGIYEHHENWDGSGYPNGISGTDISLIARIIRISDAYEAIFSRFKSRSKRNQRLILKELSYGSGTSFDPTLLDLFISLKSGASDASSDTLPSHGNLTSHGSITEITTFPLPKKRAHTPVTQVNMMMVQTNYDITHINSSFENLIGITNEAAIHTKCYNTLMGLNKPCKNCKLLIAANEQTVQSHMSKKTLRNGHLQQINQTWIPVLNQGTLLGVIELISVITED